MSRHIKAFTEIMDIIDRCNLIGRACSPDQMTKALLSVRELAFQEVTREPQSEGERAYREFRKSKYRFGTEWCDLTDVQRSKWDAKAIEVRQRKEVGQSGRGAPGEIPVKLR